MSKGQGEKFCLRWNDFENNISSSFQELKNDKDFFDVTLACEDNQLNAHKVILSACSPFFRSILKKNPHQHPLLYLKGVKYEELQSVINFMYHGEVNVAQDDLNNFLSVAEDLQVKGLTQNQPQKPQARKPSPTLNNYNENKQYEQATNKTKSSYEQPQLSPVKLSKARENHEFTTKIKTEAPVVLDGDEETENTQEIVEASYYENEPEYDQNYQDQNYQEQNYQKQNYQDQNYQNQNQSYHRPQVEQNQDPYGHIKQYVMKIPNENGFSCTICGKKCRDMYLMREHMEGVHDMSPGYECNVCSQQCRNHKGLKVHMKKFHS